MTVALAIDPGVTGAAATFVNGEAFDVVDIPTETGHVAASPKRRRIDAAAYGQLLNETQCHCGHGESPIVVIENVHAGQGKGSVANFSLGDSFGALRAGPLSRGWVCVFVPPHVWKRKLGLSSKKNDSLELARAWWPHLADRLSLKGHDGRAEALLIGAYWLDSTGRYSTAIAGERHRG